VKAPRPTRWPRVLLAVGLALVLVAGAGFAAAKYLQHRYESSVMREALLAGAARGDDPAARGAAWRTGKPLNFLLLGSDLRAGEPDQGQRSDTIIVMQVNAVCTGAYLVSIPRDLLVDIPPFPQTGFPGSQQKINAAFQVGGGGEGGVQLLSATLARLIGIKFDGAAVIDFGGFAKVVDLLGGVQMCVDTEVTSIHTGRTFTPGCRVFTGAEALDYSRQRYGLENGDYDRQRHNQQLIKAIFSTALNGGITRNPIKADQFIRAVGNSLTVDTGGVSLTDVMFALRGLRPDALVGVTVPSHPEMIGDQSFVLMDPEAASLWQAIQQAKLPDWGLQHPEWVHDL
jgi:LCP family protein required for cell wall assembly